MSHIATLILFLGPQEMVIILAIVLLLFFGGKKIPELMRGMGSGIKEFKKAAKDETEDIVDETKD